LLWVVITRANRRGVIMSSKCSLDFYLGGLFIALRICKVLTKLIDAKFGGFALGTETELGALVETHRVDLEILGRRG
jgi:hypothetical protein